MESNYHYTKCLHPRKVWNKYTQTSILAPCGHCVVCENAKASVNAIRCHAESYSHTFQFFITLTYAPEFLPVAFLVPQFEHYDVPDKHGYSCRHQLQDSYYLVSEEDGQILGEYQPKHYLDLVQVVKKCNISSESDTYRRVPILYKPHVQLFLKRLRKYLSKYSDERIRYFLCGEYGPKYYRPHYHLSLWFEDEEIATVIYEAVNKCWRFGRVDCSQSFGGATNYVARYINGTCNLPQIFRLALTKPFNTHSQHLGDQIFKCTHETFESSRPETANSISVPYGSTHQTFSMWRSVKHSIFPKCQGFYEKSEQQRLYSYQIYDVARRWFEEDSTIDIARKIVSHLVQFGTTHFVPKYETLCRYFLNSIDYCIDEFNPNNHEKLLNNIYRQLLTSKYFITNICKNDLNTALFHVRKIEEYYDMLEKQFLKEQYKIQEDDKTFVPEFYYVTLWDDDTLDKLKDDFAYKSYKVLITDRVRKHTKHKEANDANLIFNYK